MPISLSFHKVQAYWKHNSNRSRLRRERALVRYASFLSFAGFNKTLLSADATTIALLLFRYSDESVTWEGERGVFLDLWFYVYVL